MVKQQILCFKKIILKHPNRIIMKWLSVSSNLPQEIYELWNNEEKLLALSYQPGSGALRITTSQEKRVFIVRKEGFLRNRRVLRNEYGIRIGQLSHESNQDNSGGIEFNNEKFTYSIQAGFSPELVIYKQAERVFISGLPALETFGSRNHDILILVLCWYLLTPVSKKQVEEYA
jgi:hypothetical protein